jgi:hypothetical protein
MNIKTQIEKMKEEWLKYYATIAGAPAPLRLNAIPQFWLANFSSLIDLEVKLLEGKQLILKLEEMDGEEKELLIKIFGEAKTPEYMQERRYGYNMALNDSITTLQGLKKLL